MSDPLRLVDLHTDWLLQYVNETTLYDAALYPRIGARFSQSDGYLTTTSAAVVACFRRAEEWERTADPWTALGALIARVEAEFCGRLLIGRDDHTRWRDDPDGLTWAVIGIEGFDRLILDPKDLDKIGTLFERGVRLFQPVYGASNRLGGSAIVGDDRGLTDLGRAFLQALDDVAATAGGPRPLLDLAHLNPRCASDTLAWLESDEGRANRVIPVYSHGALWHEGFPMPRAITFENLTRLRAIGGVIGFSVCPPFYRSAEALKAAIERTATIPHRGLSGYKGIAIGSDFLGVDETAPGLRNAAEVITWIQSAFSAETAAALIQDNGAALLARMTGATAG
jgi:membrane dipeptidase